MGNARYTIYLSVLRLDEASQLAWGAMNCPRLIDLDIPLDRRAAYWAGTKLWDSLDISIATHRHNLLLRLDNELLSESPQLAKIKLTSISPQQEKPTCLACSKLGWTWMQIRLGSWMPRMRHTLRNGEPCTAPSGSINNLWAATCISSNLLKLPLGHRPY